MQRCELNEYNFEISDMNEILYLSSNDDRIEKREKIQIQWQFENKMSILVNLTGFFSYQISTLTAICI